MVFIEAIQYGNPLEYRPKYGEWEAKRSNGLMKAFRNELPVEGAVKLAADAIRGVLGLN